MIGGLMLILQGFFVSWAVIRCLGGWPGLEGGSGLDVYCHLIVRVRGERGGCLRRQGRALGRGGEVVIPTPFSLPGSSRGPPPCLGDLVASFFLRFSFLLWLGWLSQDI